VRSVAYQKEGEKLSRIKEVAYSYVYRSIPFSVVKSSIAIFLVEVCRKSVRGSDSYEDIYNFMVKGLIHLDNTNSGLAHFHILFLIDLAGRLGFELQNNYTTETQLFNLVDGSFTELVPNFELAMDAESSYCLSRYLKKQEPYNWSKQMRLTILQKLIDYYRYHVDDFGELKSYTVLSELYN
ncbi:MAG: DNA repair protein RecO C-terminal domain-containing protein, partial [Bacteroidota bacterium]